MSGSALVATEQNLPLEPVLGTAPAPLATAPTYNLSGPATVLSRRLPWPYDLIIAGTGVILKPSEEGLLIGKKLQTLSNVAPITYDYSSQPVYAERTFAFRRIKGGYGERVQRAPLPARYYYAINADLSIGGLQIKGPLSHDITPPLTGQIDFFVDFLVDPFVGDATTFTDGPMTTYAGAGRYVLERTGDAPSNWTVSRDFGAGVQVTKAVVYWSAGSGGKYCLYVTTDKGELWQFDGAAWVLSAQKAFTITVLRDELWICDGRHTVRSCTADPLVAANWNAEIIVGDLSQQITNLECLDNRLYIFKENGVFSLNPDTSSNDLFPSFRQQPLPRNGVNAQPWLSRLWFGYGDSYYFMDLQGGLTPTGPNLLMENNSEVQGVVMAFAGHASWFGYYGLYNPENDCSYLVKHGTWINPDESQTDEYEFHEVPNGAIKKWTGKQLTSLYVSNSAGGNTRLYCGFSDGSLAWILLPEGSPNPAYAGSGCEFTAEDSYVYWPLHHAMFQADAKHFRGFSVFGPRIGTHNNVRVQYRVGQAFAEMDPSLQNPWVDVGSPFTFDGQRIDLDANVFGYSIEVRHDLISDNQATPVIEGVALHEAVRPALQLEYTWTVNARRYLARRDGVIDPRTPEQIRTAMLAAAATVGSVDVVMADEGLQAVTVIDYSEALSPVTKRYGVEWDIAMKGVQFRTITIYGTWDRVALYDWDVVAQYTWDSILYLVIVLLSTTFLRLAMTHSVEISRMLGPVLSATRLAGISV